VPPSILSSIVSYPHTHIAPCKRTKSSSGWSSYVLASMNIRRDSLHYLVLGENEMTANLPETRHFGSSVSNLSSTPGCKPALQTRRQDAVQVAKLVTSCEQCAHMLSALFVRRLTQLISPARGPARRTRCKFKSPACPCHEEKITNRALPRMKWLRAISHRPATFKSKQH
jgi:hypothetical protein